MCVICYKPAGALMPAKKTFKAMYRHNPDGAGFMYLDGGKVQIVKGLMSYSAFQNALAQVRDKVDSPFVFHFRIATHGGISPEMTQPFPLTSSGRQLRATRTTADTGIAHNGIIMLCNDARKMSDTAQFISQYMTRICTGRAPFDDINLDIIESCIDSKMCILEASGAVHILGHGWLEDGGLLYSNSSYLDYKTTKKAAHKAAKNDYYYAPYSWDMLGDSSDYCDGYCNTCTYRAQCWDTVAATDRGINSI